MAEQPVLRERQLLLRGQNLRVVVPRIVERLRDEIIREKGPAPDLSSYTEKIGSPGQLGAGYGPAHADALKRWMRDSRAHGGDGIQLEIMVENFPRGLEEVRTQVTGAIGRNSREGADDLVSRISELARPDDEEFTRSQYFRVVLGRLVPAGLAVRVLQALGSLGAADTLDQLVRGEAGQAYEYLYNKGVRSLPAPTLAGAGATAGLEWGRYAQVDDKTPVELYLEFTPEGMARLIRPDLFRDREEIKEPLSQNIEVAWSEERGRVGNLAAALETHARLNGEFWEKLRGEKVLVRPGMVDPGHPDACTHPAALYTLLARLKWAGVSEILIGDEPAVGPYRDLKETGGRIEDCYHRLKYEEVVAEIRKLGGEMPKITFVDFSKEQVDQLEVGLPIRRFEGVAAVINLVIPKDHGQYYVSCGLKSAMGLVPVDRREAYFHRDGHTPVAVVTRVMKEWADAGKLAEMTEDNAADVNAAMYVEAAARTDPQHMLAMAEFNLAVARYYADRGIPVLTVVDGADRLRGNEHVGHLEKLDIAAVGLNPLAIDLAVVQKLGLVLDTSHYLTLLARELGVRSDVHGDELVASRTSRRLKRTFRDARLVDGRLQFRFFVKEPV